MWWIILLIFTLFSYLIVTFFIWLESKERPDDFRGNHSIHAVVLIIAPIFLVSLIITLTIVIIGGGVIDFFASLGCKKCLDIKRRMIQRGE